MKALMLLALVACGAPHVDPMPRTVAAQLATIVALQSSCAEQDPFDAFAAPEMQPLPDGTKPTLGDQAEWGPSRQFTGVVISERFVLTAAHAVRCPLSLRVTGSTINGATLQLVVERDDVMFPVGEPSDVARLELASAGRIGLGVAPPAVRDARGGERCCAQTLHGAMCGTADPYHRGVLLDVSGRAGDSGSPVYCDIELVGIVTRTGPTALAFVPLDSYWLEGT